MDVQNYAAYNQANQLINHSNLKTPRNAKEFTQTCLPGILAWVEAFREEDEDPQDIVQHLMLRLLSSQVWVRPPRQFKLILWTALHNEFHNYRRGCARHELVLFSELQNQLTLALCG